MSASFWGCFLLRVLFIFLLLTSCSYMQKPLELKGDTIEYAEALFKRQNQVTLEVMMLLEEELTLAEENRLSDAELQLHDKCQLLNEMAVYEMSGKEVSYYFQGQVQRSFKVCDESVKNLEFILKQISE